MYCVEFAIAFFRCESYNNPAEYHPAAHYAHHRRTAAVYGAGHWNAWVPASIYLQDNKQLPIQNIMRSILIANSNLLNSSGSETDRVDDFAETIKYSTIILTTVPVLCIYPFLQKYFVKGVMVGAVKG